MKQLLNTPLRRLVALIVTCILVFGVYGGVELYGAHMEGVALEERIKDMGPYEVCQFALKEFGMKMVEDMGCLKPIPDSALVKESTPI